MENSEHFKTVPRSLGSSRVRRSKNRHASQFASLTQTHTHGAYSSLSKSYRTSATATLSSCPDANLIDDSAMAAGYHLPAKRARLMETSTSNSYAPLSHKGKLTKKYTTSTTSTSLSSLSTSSTSLRLASTATQTTSTFTAATSSFTTSSTLTLDVNSASATGSEVPDPSSSNSSNSIDQAIQQALQKITRFSQLPLEQPPKPVGCIKCQSPEFAYEIQTCRHLVCRECLVELSQQEKCICNKTFRSSDVERYHKL